MHTTGLSTANRWCAGAAIVAGLLWATQGLIWTLGPKFQATDAPYAITNRPLFAVFWLSIIGAVLGSGVAVLGMGARQQGRTALGRAGAILAGMTVGIATVAGLAASAAAVGIAEETLLGVLALTLNGAGLTLLLSLVLLGITSLRRRVGGWQRALPASLATLTFCTLLALAANGQHALAALVLAVLTVTLTGATWLLLGTMLWPRRAA